MCVCVCVCVCVCARARARVGRCGCRGWGLPAVEIVTGQPATIIAVDDAVGVEHGHDFEDKVRAEAACFSA